METRKKWSEDDKRKKPNDFIHCSREEDTDQRIYRRLKVRYYSNDPSHMEGFYKGRSTRDLNTLSIDFSHSRLLILNSVAVLSAPASDLLEPPNALLSS
ncbi:hypothetical protein Tco_0496770 [Tanacetum coccineum]